jgi:hypothetical protein
LGLPAFLVGLPALLAGVPAKKRSGLSLQSFFGKKPKKVFPLQPLTQIDLR